MERTLQKFITSKNTIMNYFGCDKEMPLKLLLKSKYEIYGDDGFYFLKYWDKNSSVSEYVIAKNDGEAMIYERGKYILIVAIDCLKIAHLFRKD